MNNTNQDIDSLRQELFVAAALQQKFLQTEYFAVLVDSFLDSQTDMFFRQLRTNTPAFYPDSLADLKDPVAVFAQFAQRASRRSSYRGREKYRVNETNRRV